KARIRPYSKVCGGSKTPRTSAQKDRNIVAANIRHCQIRDSIPVKIPYGHSDRDTPGWKIRCRCKGKCLSGTNAHSQAEQSASQSHKKSRSFYQSCQSHFILPLS